MRAALAQSQMLLGDLEAAQIIESIYGALVAYSQQVMLRMKAEDPEIGGVDLSVPDKHTVFHVSSTTLSTS